MMMMVVVVVNIKDENKHLFFGVLFFSCFEVCLRYAVFWPRGSLCLSWFYNPILLETFGFETVLYCPLTHRYLCACCFGGQGNGDKTNL